jgi:hypothetical protein
MSKPTRKPTRKQAAHVVNLVNELTEARAAQISSFYGDEVPTFRQGAPSHELEELVTAEDVTRWVKRIGQQEEQLAAMTTAATQVVRLDNADPIILDMQSRLRVMHDCFQRLAAQGVIAAERAKYTVELHRKMVAAVDVVARKAMNTWNECSCGCGKPVGFYKMTREATGV